jgi:hypothetical protein
MRARAQSDILGDAGLLAVADQFVRRSSAPQGIDDLRGRLVYSAQIPPPRRRVGLRECQMETLSASSAACPQGDAAWPLTGFEGGLGIALSDGGWHERICRRTLQGDQINGRHSRPIHQTPSAGASSKVREPTREAIAGDSRDPDAGDASPCGHFVERAMKVEAW